MVSWMMKAGQLFYLGIHAFSICTQAMALEQALLSKPAERSDCLRPNVNIVGKLDKNGQCQA